MFLFMLITALVLYLALIVVASMHPSPSRLSHFELRRRAESGGEQEKFAAEREQRLPDILALWRIVQHALLIAVSFLAVAAFGWGVGILFALIAILEYGIIALWRPVRRFGAWLYRRVEPGVLRFIVRCAPLFKILRRSVPPFSHDPQFHSVDDLRDLIERSPGILGANEQALLVHGLSFGERRVKSVMTPASKIASISKGEFLGPLVLSELHELGHSRLPVVSQDIHHVVGTLHLDDLLSLDVKRSVTAEKAMDPKVYYIRSNDTLEHALGSFLSTKHHLLIVINKDRETVGLLTLNDVIGALIGRKIEDADHNHQDARAIAAAEAGNNTPEKYEDV